MISFYHRQPNKVNVIRTGNDNEEETYSQMLEKFCKRCGRELVFREDIDNLFCPVCAWEPVKKPRQKIEKQDWGSSI